MKNTALINDLYIAILGRAPDVEGMRFWRGKLETGATQAQVADQILGLGLAEVQARYPEAADAPTLIQSFYRHVLGREADAEGLRYWSTRLEESGASWGELMTELLQAVNRYRGEDPLGWASREYLIAQQEVAINFLDVLERDGVVQPFTPTAVLISRIALELARGDAAAPAAPGAHAALAARLAELALAKPEIMAYLLPNEAAFHALADGMAAAMPGQGKAEVLTLLAYLGHAAVSVAQLETLLAGGSLADFVEALSGRLDVDTLLDAAEQGPAALQALAAEVGSFGLRESAGVYSFAGTLDGEISLSITADGVISFHRDAMTALRTLDLDAWVPGHRLELGAGQVLALSLEQADLLSHAGIDAVTPSLQFVLTGAGKVVLREPVVDTDTNLIGIAPQMNVDFAGHDALQIAAGVHLELHPSHADGVAMVGEGQVSTALHLAPLGPLTLNVQTHGAMNVIGGAGLNDVISATGSGQNLIQGGLGGDRITLGAGQDTVMVLLWPEHLDPALSSAWVSDSQAAPRQHDVVLNFSLADDKLSLPGGTELLSGTFGEEVTTIPGLEISRIEQGVASFAGPAAGGKLSDHVVAVLMAMATQQATVAFVMGADSYVLQGDGVAGVSPGDSMVMLAGVQIHNLGDILI